MAQHLTKLFDSMASLKFEKGKGSEDTKVALGMYSKDGEYVDLSQPCDLSGQVSSHLLLVIRALKKSNLLTKCSMFASKLHLTVGRPPSKGHCVHLG